MTKIITYITIIFLLTVSSIFAQEKLTFEQKIKSLSVQMDSVVEAEKILLKKEIKAIEKEYNIDKITFEEAETQKKEIAKLHANNIKNKIAKIEIQVHHLVQGKVTSKIKKVEDEQENDKDVWTIKIKKDSKINWQRKDKRTHFYLVFALGLNNLIKNGDINSINNSDFKFGTSRFYEVGLNYKTRLLENSGLMYVNYGLSLRYNNLRAKNNQYLVVNGNETNLVTHTMDLTHSRLKNVQLVVPVFLEFDFSKPKIKKDKTVFRRNRSFRLGVGAFGGVNLKTKQYLEFNENGIDKETEVKGDFNVNNFVYGMQGLVGYKDLSLYVKYDMQDIFSNSFKNQKNISMGLRFDL